MAGSKFIAVAFGLSWAFGAAVASAATLFTTQSDFTNWGVGNPNGGAVTTTGDTDFGVINGLGNTTAPGAVSAPGALTITVPAGSTFGNTLSPGQQGNNAFLAEISGNTLLVDFNSAGLTGGNYFQLLLNINASTGYVTYAPTTITGSDATFQTATYVLPTIPTSGYSYFQFGFVANTNRTGSITVDNIRSVPEPTTLAALGLATFFGLRRRR